MSRLTKATVNSFAKAVQGNELDAVSRLIDRHPSLIRKPLDQRNSIALHFAAKSGHPLMAKLLVARGSPLDVRDMNGNLPLHIAIESKQFETAVALLELGADPNSYVHADESGMHPLHLAAVLPKGHNLLRTLIDYGAKVDAHWGYDMETPLFSAAWRGYTENVRVLLAAGANPSHVVRDRTPLGIAEQLHRTETIELLRTWLDADRARQAVNDVLQTGVELGALRPLGFVSPKAT